MCMSGDDPGQWSAEYIAMPRQPGLPAPRTVARGHASWAYAKERTGKQMGSHAPIADSK
jgi:hypothetical protein